MRKAKRQMDCRLVARVRVGLVVCLAAAITAVAASGVSAARSAAHQSAIAQDGMPGIATDLATLRARFSVLSQQHTNKCSLRPQDVDTLAVGGHLQGSCCTAMNFAHYVRQVRGLSAYRAHQQVPRDPYDIDVRQAKQLLAYDSQIKLTASEQGLYKQAMKLSHEHGPCCCHCWRWPAFEGQAKYLIRQRGCTASQIARVWNLEDGCGS